MGRAVIPSRSVIDSSPDPTLRERGSLLRGACRLAAGDWESARVDLDRAVESRNPAIAGPARRWRAEAALGGGDPAAALSDLEDVHEPGVAFDRALALERLHRADDAARVLADEAGRGPYAEGEWLAALDTLGSASPEAADWVE